LLDSLLQEILIAMSLMKALMTRAEVDLGVETFLERLFLILSGELKQCRLVCKEWNSFIMNMWRSRWKMLSRLNSNWSLGIPCSERHIDFKQGAGKVVRMIADDQSLVVVMNSNRIFVIRCATLETLASIQDFEYPDAYNDTSGDLEVVISQSFILACHTVKEAYLYDPPQTELMLRTYDRTGQFVLEKLIRNEEVLWSFKVSFSDLFVVLLLRSRVSVYRVEEGDNAECEDDVKGKKLTLSYTVKKISGLVTVIKVIGDEFITGDIGGKVKFWDIQTGAKIRTLDTENAIQDFELYGNYLVTVGGINGATGVTFWDIHSLQRIKALYDIFENQDDGSFSRIIVRNDIFLLDGYNHAIVFGLFNKGWKVNEIARIRGHVLALNTTCVYKANYIDFNDPYNYKRFLE